MLTIEVPAQELFDESTSRFITRNAVTLELEHSLVSLSKWESKWEIAFLGDTQKTPEQTLDYIKSMTLNQVDPEVYTRIPEDRLREINDYLVSKQTATWFSLDGTPKTPGRKQTITAELIYYWMVALNIPPEFEKWHLNRLITFIRVCNEKNTPADKKKSKMTRAQLIERNRAINAERRAKYNTNG